MRPQPEMELDCEFDWEEDVMEEEEAADCLWSIAVWRQVPWSV